MSQKFDISGIHCLSPLYICWPPIEQISVDESKKFWYTEIGHVSKFNRIDHPIQKEKTMRTQLFLPILLVCLCIVPLAQAVDPSLVMYLSFDENKGDVAKDQSPFGNHATIKGKATWGEGKFNSGMKFTVSGYLIVQDADSLDLTSAMTISMWAKLLAATGDNQSGVEKEPAWQAGEYNLLPEYGGGVLLQMEELPDECDDEAIGGPSIIDKDWHFIAATWDGSVIKIYIDGKKAKELPCKGKLSKGNGALYIGSRGGGGRWVEGFLDEIKIYNRALDAKEITADMENPAINLAVSPAEKLATSWGAIKRRF